MHAMEGSLFPVLRLGWPDCSPGENMLTASRAAPLGRSHQHGSLLVTQGAAQGRWHRGKEFWAGAACASMAVSRTVSIVGTFPIVFRQLEGVCLVASTPFTVTCCSELRRRLLLSCCPTRTPWEDGKKRLVCLLYNYVKEHNKL